MGLKESTKSKIFVGVTIDGLPVLGNIIKHKKDFIQHNYRIQQAIDCMETLASTENFKSYMLLPSSEVSVTVNEGKEEIYIKVIFGIDENETKFQGSVKKGEGFSSFLKAFKQFSQLHVMIMCNESEETHQYFGIGKVGKVSIITQ